MRRLLLVSHRALHQGGGPSARWRSLAERLPEHGWEVDVLSAPVPASAAEFDPAARGRVARRARVMGRVAQLSDPLFGLAGVRPDALPLSMLWLRAGAAELRRRLATDPPDAVLATGPPMAGVLAARRGIGPLAPPFVVELRDLWAGSPAFDRGGPVLPALERWAFEAAAAVVACTPEAVADLAARHPPLATRLHEIPNGFEPELLARRDGPREARPREPGGAPPEGPRPGPAPPLELLHSGTLSVDRPLAPLLAVLAREPYRSRVRLSLHGHVVPAIAAEVAAAPDAPVTILPPSSWGDAVARIAAADATLITQARGAGDATAVASKVYEYLALGRPVVCLSDGGATEALLHRLGAGGLTARLGDEASIAAALDRLVAGRIPPVVPPEALAPYARDAAAARMAGLLDDLVATATVAPR